MISNLQKFYINSKNLESGTDYNFTYKLQINKDVNSVALTQWALPTSFYNVSVNSGNYFTVTENNLNVFNITIPEGNYTQTQLLSKVSVLLTAGSQNAITYVLSLNNNVNYSDGKVLVTCTVGGNPNALICSFVFQNNILCELLGFNPGITANFTANIVSDNVANMSAKGSIYLQSDIANNNNNNISGLNSSNNILGTMNIAFAQPFTYVNFSYDMFNNMTNINIKSIYSFWITDEDSNFVNLRGCDHSFTLLCFTYHYDYYPMIKALYIMEKNKDKDDNKIKLMNY
jgi:hypothetical protein